MKKGAKIPLILLAIAVIVAVVCFSLAKDNPYLLWAGAGATVLAVIFLLITLTRFLRNRSIASGLFISTTVLTLLYFLGTRFVDTAMPIAYASTAVANAEAGNTTTFFFTPVFFAQVGLFALWFLLLLFIIYVYVRPIKRIDYLLGQIIAQEDIKKMKLGHGAQYEQIAVKLQMLSTLTKRRQHPVKRGKNRH